MSYSLLSTISSLSKEIEAEKEREESKSNSNPTQKNNITGIRGMGFFSKAPDIDIKNEPLSAYYETRKKIIFGKINILEDEYIVSQFLVNSQKKVNSEFKKVGANSCFFLDIPNKVYLFCLCMKENFCNFCLIIHLYLLLNKEDKALEIFLLMCKENLKKFEYMYNKLNVYCNKSSSKMKNVTPGIAKILINTLSCAIKLSVKFSKTHLQNVFISIYLKTIFALNLREIKTSTMHNYKNEIKYNRLYVYANCLFDAAIFNFYNYFPINITTKLLEHCLELYNDSFREKNNNELILMMKVNFNSGFFYFVDDKNKEAINCLQTAKELITDIIQNNLNSKEEEKEFLSDLSGYSYLDEEKNILFCLKINNNRISKLHEKSANLNKYIKENANTSGKKASSVVLGSKKYELKLPSLLEQIKRKINLEIDLQICQIEMNKKNYKGAYEQINLILKSNGTKDDNDTKSPQRKKRLGVNKNFRSLKTYQNIRVKPKISLIREDLWQTVDLTERDFQMIFSFLVKIEQEIEHSNNIEEKINAAKRKTLTANNVINKSVLDNYTNFKKMEKFFIFICNLSLFQLKILNESQPSYSAKRDDLPIIFSTPFRDCLTNSQRMYLDELETMSLSRYIILIDSRKDISPENLDYKYMKYKIKTQTKEEEDEFDYTLNFSEMENNCKNNLTKGRNYKRQSGYSENRGIYSLSTNINLSNSNRRTISVMNKITSTKKFLSFNDDEADENNLILILQKIKNEKNEKFMYKYRKTIREYLYELKSSEKKFFLNNPNLLKKMIGNLAKEQNKIKRKNNKLSLYDKNSGGYKSSSNNISYSFSFETSQKSQKNMNE